MSTSPDAPCIMQDGLYFFQVQFFLIRSPMDGCCRDSLIRHFSETRANRVMQKHNLAS